MLAAALAPAGASAEWEAVTSTIRGDADGGEAVERNDALVRSDDGAELRIWLEADGRLTASFRLRPGLVILDPESCPTFQIDTVRPENLAAPRHECTVEGDEARVVLARASDGRVNSATLRDLINGVELRVRYRLAHAGYGATRFTLRGSRQALNKALGEGTRVAGR